MNRDRELTPAEIVHAKMAGIPTDRPGLGGEYPLMLYRKGNTTAEYLNEPFDIGGVKNVETFVAQDADEELVALEEGFSRTLPRDEVEVKRGPGRPKVDAG